MRDCWRHVLPALTGVMLALPDATGQEWTRFRGPNGSGESEATTIPAQWTDNDFNWKLPLPA